MMRRRPRTRLARVALSLVVLLAAVLAVATAYAASAAGSLAEAQAAVRTARGGDMPREDMTPALRAARADAVRAHATLRRFPVDIAAALPVVGRSFAAERAVARTAEELLTGAVVATETLSALDAEQGSVDVRVLRQLQTRLEGPSQRASDALLELSSRTTSLTPPPVRRGVERALRTLGPAVHGMQRAVVGLEAAEGLLGGAGPRSVLVALENNAELRGTGGYVASFATGTLDKGRLELGPLRDAVALADPPSSARRVTAPTEFKDDYGPLSGDTTVWRSWNMSPHVPDSAVVGARAAGVLLGREPDVVVLVDVPAMGALARLGGGRVSLPDGTAVSAEELTSALLVDSYADAGADVEAQLGRRAQLQSAATLAVERLLGGDVPVLDAARTLGRLASGRHLKVWSARAEEQRALVAAGIAGAIEAPRGSDLSHISVNNIGANKLDVYVEREVDVDVVVGAQRADVTQRVRFTNRAPAGLVPYVAGVKRPGTVVSRVEMSVPPGAVDVTATLDGRPWPGFARQGESRQRLVTRLALPRAASALLEVRYALPTDAGRYRLRLLPQPLAEDAELRLVVRAASGERLGRVTGAAVSGGLVQERGSWSRSRDISVTLQRGTVERWSDAVRRFWSSPVTVDVGARPLRQ